MVGYAIQSHILLVKLDATQRRRRQLTASIRGIEVAGLAMKFLYAPSTLYARADRVGFNLSTRPGSEERSKQVSDSDILELILNKRPIVSLRKTKNLRDLRLYPSNLAN